MSLLTGLAAYYKLNEAAGTTRLDSLGVNDLTDHNTVGSSPGKIANAADFVSASTQYLSCADNSAFQMGVGDFSMAAWFKFSNSDDTGSYLPIAWYGRPQSATGYGIGIIDAGATAVVIGIVNDGVTGKEVDYETNIGDGLWHFVVATFDRAGNLSVILDNGTPKTSSMITVLGSVNNANGFAIGAAYDATHPLDGSVDEVGIWNRLLTGPEINDLWNGGAGFTYPFSNDVSVDLVGVAASPAIGTGTIQIQIPIHHATDGGRQFPIRSRTRVNAEGVYASPVIGRPRFKIGSIITESGSIAAARVGAPSISMDSGVSVTARRNYVIISQINTSFDGQPMPSASVGTGIGFISTEVDFYPEEIAALLQ